MNPIVASEVDRRIKRSTRKRLRRPNPTRSFPHRKQYGGGRRPSLRAWRGDNKRNDKVHAVNMLSHKRHARISSSFCQTRTSVETLSNESVTETRP